MGRFKSIQILRALSALGVVSVHAALDGFSHTSRWMGVGNAGVDVFFVISGFVMTMTAARAGSAWQFLTARLLRVAPLYWLFSLPHIALAFLTHSFTPDAFARTFLFWLGAPPYGSQPLLGAGWTLCFEMWFYAMVASAMVVGRVAWLAWAVLGGSFLALNLVHRDAQLSFLGSPLFLDFALGAAVASAPRNMGYRCGLVALGLGLTGLILSIAFEPGLTFNARMVLDPAIGGSRVALAGVPAAAIVWGALQCERSLVGPVAAAFGFLGNASYSIYLAQALVTSFLLPVPGESMATQVLSVGAIGVFCVGLGIGSYILIERPLGAAFKRLRPAPMPHPQLA